jgi:restriction system protein
LAKEWKEYQEEAAKFFRTLGMSASTDVSEQGVRTKHDIDVLVGIDLVGFKVSWVVECKHWKAPVTKLHVLALREIVSDLGADRGIILCETGFQSGAYEAAHFTNVQVTSLAELGKSSSAALASFKLRELYDRACVARERYWEISKSDRIEKGLRGEVGDPESRYSGAFICEATEQIISKAFRGLYPIEIDRFDSFKLGCDGQIVLEGPNDVFALLEPPIVDLEARLNAVTQ